MPGQTEAAALATMDRTRIRNVLFDLDGTLADTAPDLAFALNTLRAQEGLPPLPYEPIRLAVSNGSNALVRLGFDIGHGDPRFTELGERLLKLYQAHIAARTRLFPGMETVLADLEQHGLHWGVVTNKPAFLTGPLMHELGLSTRAACIVSGDSATHSKPHPAPLLMACEQVGIPPAESVYVGDAERDVEAGRQAGMRTLVALFGYIPPDVNPAAWLADAMLDSPGQLLDWLENGAATVGRPELL